MADKVGTGASVTTGSTVTEGDGDGFGASAEAISLAEKSLHFSPLLADGMAAIVGEVMVVESVIGFGVCVGNTVFGVVATLSIDFGLIASSACFFIFFEGFTAIDGIFTHL